MTLEELNLQVVSVNGLNGVNAVKIVGWEKDREPGRNVMFSMVIIRK